LKLYVTIVLAGLTIVAICVLVAVILSTLFSPF
jgi:hypothetical protein